MASGDTAPPLALSRSSPPLLGHSPSNLSSPLSDVEDKDAEPDEMDLDMSNPPSARPETPEPNGHGDAEEEDSGGETDEDSKLSEADVNDSEAETERLYDSPQKDNPTRDILNVADAVGNRQFIDRRDRTFERSPSKLQQQIQADLDAENAPSPTASLSEAEEEEEEDDDASLASSEGEGEGETAAEPEPAEEEPSRPPSQAKIRTEDPLATLSDVAQLVRQESAESRKRKRSSMAEQVPEQPLRKRTGSIGATEPEFSPDDTAVLDDEGISTNPQSGNQSGEEDNAGEAEAAAKTKEEPTESIEEDPAEPSRSRRGKRSASKKSKSNSKSPEGVGGRADQESPGEATEDADGLTAEDASRSIEDEHVDDADEEAEAAHRNEEELERKKAAWEELTAIEKQFSNFRERLYQERLEALNREEAMLTCDNPTHPEYLAMLQCIDQRRDERIRKSTLELQFKMEVLKKRAVAERAQIMSQFHQAVRESREQVLEELGQDWYNIQQERRRAANTIPDYGIRFPSTKQQSAKAAVAYNKEVSILSGFAKHVGFPAAPPISGASDDQLENDLEAITRAREPVSRQVSHQPPVFHPEFTGLPFGRNLGPAGEQFIEQTPWANPNHPSHHIQRQQSHPEATPVNRRHSHQPGGLFSSSTTTIPNGDSPVMNKSHGHSSGAGHESVKAHKMGPTHSVKRETVAQIL